MSEGRARTIPLEAIFVDVFETSLEPGELLLRVELPPLPAGARATYKKFLPATLDDYATVSVAAVVATGPDGMCTHARIALGGAGPGPFPAHEAGRSLVGRRVGDAAIRQAAALAGAGTGPGDDPRGRAEDQPAHAR